MPKTRHRARTLGSLALMLTVKNELIQGGFNERHPGRSQLHQAVLQSVAGSWFANHHRIIKKKNAAPQSLSKRKAQKVALGGRERGFVGLTAQSLLRNTG